MYRRAFLARCPKLGKKEEKMDKRFAAVLVLTIGAVIAPSVAGYGAQAFAGCPEVGQTFIRVSEGYKLYTSTDIAIT